MNARAQRRKAALEAQLRPEAAARRRTRAAKDIDEGIMLAEARRAMDADALAREIEDLEGDTDADIWEDDWR